MEGLNNTKLTAKKDLRGIRRAMRNPIKPLKGKALQDSILRMERMKKVLDSLGGLR